MCGHSTVPYAAASECCSLLVRDDYRQTIASGLKAQSDKSYHGGSFRGGYGHGLAVDIVSVKGETRAARWASSEQLWKWIDTHEKELGIGRPYLDRDPPHVAPIDGEEYAAHRVEPNTQHAESKSKEHQRLALHSDHSMSERARGARLSRAQSRTQLIQFNSSPSRVRTDWDGVRQRPHDQRSKPGIYRTSKVRLSLVRCFNPRPSPTVGDAPTRRRPLVPR